MDNIVTPEFKKSYNKVAMLTPELDENRLPKTKSLLKIFDKINKMMREKQILSCYALDLGGVGEAIFKMSIGNGYGFIFNDTLSIEEIFAPMYGSFIVEVERHVPIENVIGMIIEKPTISHLNETLDINELLNIYENKLESVYSCNISQEDVNVQTFKYISSNVKKSNIKIAKPKVLIPVFPCTNCEYESARAFETVSADTNIYVINNMNEDNIKKV